MTCVDCGAAAAKFRFSDNFGRPRCEQCEAVSWILNSVDESLRIYIPQANESLLLAARARIAKMGDTRVTLLNAIERRLRKLAKEKRS